MNANNQVAIWICVAGAAFLLTRDPKCNHGCKTVAEHLLKFGVDEALSGLFA